MVAHRTQRIPERPDHHRPGRRSCPRDTQYRRQKADWRDPDRLSIWRQAKCASRSTSPTTAKRDALPPSAVLPHMSGVPAPVAERRPRSKPVKAPRAAPLFVRKDARGAAPPARAEAPAAPVPPMKSAKPRHSAAPALSGPFGAELAPEEQCLPQPALHIFAATVEGRAGISAALCCSSLRWSWCSARRLGLRILVRAQSSYGGPPAADRGA